MCYLVLHFWTRWQSVGIGGPPNIPTYQHRTCRICHRIQVRSTGS